MKQSIENKPDRIHFKKVTMSHREIILKWFQQEHVKEFYYGDGLQSTLKNLNLFLQGINNNGSYTFFHWIACYDDVPFAFMMTSPLEGLYDKNDDYNKWYVSGKKIFTLDVLIGDEKFLGKGLGSVMIREFILSQYSDADFFIIDPEMSNSKAIHVYQKVGFKKTGEFIPDSNPKPHVMMRLEVDELRISG